MGPEVAIVAHSGNSAKLLACLPCPVICIHYRWLPTKQLKNMPAIRGTGTAPHYQMDYTNGWMGYFLSRMPPSSSPGKDSNYDGDQACASFIKDVKNDLSMIDCISTPVTICSACHRMGLLPLPSSAGRLNVVCIGSSEKAEERIVRETNCFDELLLGFPSVSELHVYLVGPEISVSTTELKTSSVAHRTIHYHLFRATAIDFFRSQPSLLSSKNSIVVGINCGFGNFENPVSVRYELLLSWLPDLFFLTATKLPVIFMCANEYSDLVGEVAVCLSICGCKFISHPEQNGFSFASTFVAEDGPRKEGNYSCGNSYLYAVCGCDKARRNVSLQQLLLGKEAAAVGGKQRALAMVLDALNRHDPPDALEWNKYIDAVPDINPTVPTAYHNSSRCVSDTAIAEAADSGTEKTPSVELETKQASPSISSPPPPPPPPDRCQHEPAHPLIRFEQHVDSATGTLSLTIAFNSQVVCNQLADIDLSVGSSGQTVKVSVNVSGEDGQPTGVYSESVQLETRVVEATGKAKFSGKKKRIVYTAHLM
jgi:hypothetical protein